VTIFIIIAVILVSIGIAFIFVQQYQSKNKIKLLRDVESYVESNVDGITAEAITLLGLQGGYIKAPERSIDIGFEEIPYYYYKGKTLVPSLNTIENQLSEYIEQEIKKMNFSQFSQLDITYAEPNVKVKVKDDVIKIYVNYSITVSHENMKTKLKNIYEREYNLRINKMLDIAKNLTNATSQDPEHLNIELISYFQDTYDIIITPFLFKGAVIYKMDDQKFKLKDMPYYTFNFATKNE